MRTIGAVVVNDIVVKMDEQMIWTCEADPMLSLRANEITGMMDRGPELGYPQVNAVRMVAVALDGSPVYPTLEDVGGEPGTVH